MRDSTATNGRTISHLTMILGIICIIIALASFGAALYLIITDVRDEVNR